ncbi:hypothetical protein CTheo_6552 [Ceratobasidium theobromae]|uniref:Uncharacterized protein n=1 Tax=Ceratobasidium theobromae TaxID=1582974 RepID=A0A5N5QER3_9AGAM|nr:hypothetical protein CTheo_6552 [Ceratobasidium theobromae]
MAESSLESYMNGHSSADEGALGSVENDLGVDTCQYGIVEAVLAAMIEAANSRAPRSSGSPTIQGSGMLGHLLVLPRA